MIYCLHPLVPESIESSGPPACTEPPPTHTRAPAQRARLWIERAGPRVIRADRVFAQAAHQGLFLDRGTWRDPHADG